MLRPTQTNTTPSNFAPIPAVTLAAPRPVNHAIQEPVTSVYVQPGMQTSVTGHHVLNPFAAHPIHVWPQTNDARTLMSLPIAAPGLGDPTQGIADYLRWKEVLFKRVYEFNDKAEAYHVWKATFLGTMSEINVNAADHVDLLTKWLGKPPRKLLAGYVRLIQITRESDLGEPR